MSFAFFEGGGAEFDGKQSTLAAFSIDKNGVGKGKPEELKVKNRKNSKLMIGKSIGRGGKVLFCCGFGLSGKFSPFLNELSDENFLNVHFGFLWVPVFL